MDVLAHVLISLIIHSELTLGFVDEMVVQPNVPGSHNHDLPFSIKSGTTDFGITLRFELDEDKTTAEVDEGMCCFYIVFKVFLECSIKSFLE